MRTTLAVEPAEPYDVVFTDPPYPLTEAALAADLDQLQLWLAPDAIVVVERSRRSPEPTWPARLEGRRSKRYGETTLWYGRADPPRAPEAPDAPPDGPPAGPPAGSAGGAPDHP